MPAQVDFKNIYFPDGCDVQIKPEGDGSFTSMGVIEGDATATFNFDVNQFESGNAGKSDAQYKNMTVEGGFVLNSLVPSVIAKLGAGLFTATIEDGTPISVIPDQVVASGWADDTIYDIVMYDSASSSVEVRTQLKPVLTTVTLDLGGTPEVLVEGTEYVIVESSNATSGWGISFISGNMSTISPTTFAITLDYGTNTPIAAEIMTAGTTTKVASQVEMRYVHTDDNGLVRSFYMPSVEPQSGGFQFNFKGAPTDGAENMPITFQAKIDTSKEDGAQLFTWRIEEGAA